MNSCGLVGGLFDDKNASKIMSRLLVSANIESGCVCGSFSSNSAVIILYQGTAANIDVVAVSSHTGNSRTFNWL